jgi:hypothetical protein
LKSNAIAWPVEDWCLHGANARGRCIGKAIAHAGVMVLATRQIKPASSGSEALFQEEVCNASF